MAVLSEEAEAEESSPGPDGQTSRAWWKAPSRAPVIGSGLTAEADLDVEYGAGAT